LANIIEIYTTEFGTYTCICILCAKIGGNVKFVSYGRPME